MPVIQSAKKALRQSKKRRIVNQRRSKTMKDLIKEISLLIEENKKDEAKKILPAVVQAIDKAVKRGILKPNTAARRKSRLTKLVNK